MKELFDFWTIIYILPAVISFALGFYIIPRTRLVLGEKKSFVISSKGTRYKSTAFQIGGINFFPILIISFCVVFLLPQIVGDATFYEKMQASMYRVLQVIMGGAVLFILGMKEDLKCSASKVVFLGLIGTSALFPFTNLYIDNLHGLLGFYEIPKFVGILLSWFIAFYVTYMFKFLDGVDGLSSGIAAVSSAIFLVISLIKHFSIAAVVSSTLLGLVVAFYIYKMFLPNNRKVMLGSCGSYMVGYMIAYMVLGLARQGGGLLPDAMLMVCLNVVAFPIMDILRVAASRARDGRDLFAQDRNQINHKLIRAGLPRPMVPIAICAFTAAYVIVAYISAERGVNQTWVLLWDSIMFALIHLILNFFINKTSNKTFHRSWNKTYGEDVWNEDIPTEILQTKQEVFGTMGLPKYIIEGNDVAFIPDGMNEIERNIKRLTDFFVSGCCLIVFSPLFLLSYILIKMDDGGPAIFRQERIGRFGRPFYILKFRSMRLDAEKMGPQLSHGGGDDDPRLTKIGKFLRAHHLDELPQLWNVFRGDMAFIGYRPERKFYIDQIMEIDPRYAFLYQIRPGVTSYATLYNGYTDTMEKMQRRLELDLYYLGRRSWWMDIKVLFLTFMSIVGGKKF